MEYTKPKKYKIYRSKKPKLYIVTDDYKNLEDEHKVDFLDSVESSDIEVKQYIAHNKQSCDEVKEKFKEMTKSVVNRGKVGITVFASSLVIAIILTILFIPSVYNGIQNLVPNVWYRLFVIFIFFLAIVYLVERFFLMINS